MEKLIRRMELEEEKIPLKIGAFSMIRVVQNNSLHLIKYYYNNRNKMVEYIYK